MAVAHPAKFHADILDAVAPMMVPGWRLLDPFAGVGTVHQLGERCGIDTVGVEIEPEWATVHPRTVVGDALALPFDDCTFDTIVVSPCYGNRMSDHHDAQERCKRCEGTGLVDDMECERCNGKGHNTYKRITYRHVLGRRLHKHNTGKLQWGTAYRSMHEAAWAEAVRVLKPGGLFVLNSKDHVRKDKRQRVTAWHIRTLEANGLHLGTMTSVHTPGMGFGENRDVRAGDEVIVTLSSRFGQQHFDWQEEARAV